MAKNLPYLQFFCGDWMRDPQVGMCALSTRGFWFEALCAMHLSDTYALSGTPDQLSRSLRCSVSEVNTAVEDLKATGTADVTICRGVVTLTSRRRQRQGKQRLGARERKRKERSHANVTGEMSDIRSQISESRNDVGGESQRLDEEIRAYFQAHSMLVWDLESGRRMRKLVDGAGWQKAKALVSEAIDRGIALPVGWALQKWGNQQAAAAGDDDEKAKKDAAWKAALAKTQEPT